MFGSLGGMLAQVQNMQESLKEVEVTVAVAEGAVTVTMNGAQNLVAVNIAPELIQGDIEHLEDVVMAGIKLAQQESRTKVQEEVAKLTGINVNNFMNMFNS
ncbi:YbaB/EbfC family nucleoid-associated protein [Desulforamulus ferrireducens]|uniref:Nucleoid-associated protein B0537_01185 n=1 Tax=Desulforamulus ferrireducens TaxID=1833852 RepID=A0A1S6IST4_9FIRM|nr:YbaB/EbfC family nucleoid-associated protein [Desulforamulus ferrireducens]AQS57839.1 nucleoid-associated protein, YbaB/EbfC family [Desulforamulus ferrireducens]